MVGYGYLVEKTTTTTKKREDGTCEKVIFILGQWCLNKYVALMVALSQQWEEIGNTGVFSIPWLQCPLS